jgi:four helix bundle protein
MVAQVNRATASIPLNLAEDSGETAVGRKAYFYRVARGSAAELSAALDHMVDLEMLDEDDIERAKAPGLAKRADLPAINPRASGCHPSPCP